jgi:RNA polymerase sigma factor (sigma-70 family)
MLAEDSIPRITTRLTMYLRRHSAEWEDILQDTMLRLHQSDLSHVENLDAYAVRSAQMQLFDRHRKAVARRAADHCEIPLSLASREPLPEAETGRHELAERAVGALRDPKQITIIRLFYFGDLSEEEVSEKTGYPLGTVKVLKFRAMQRMRKKLGVHVS